MKLDAGKGRWCLISISRHCVRGLGLTVPAPALAVSQSWPLVVQFSKKGGIAHRVSNKQSGGSNPLKRISWCFVVLLVMMTGASAARADIITYTFTGAGGTLGTNWTLIDPNGYLTPPTGNVVGLLQTDTDLILDDPINGPEDFGPLTEIAFGTPPSEPSYYGMQMASSSFHSPPSLFHKWTSRPPGLMNSQTSSRCKTVFQRVSER